ncbi:hypothetical protein N7532_004717 [Penicillium argentinense]|uniref:Uncharacterized protein n=1 Tax=Penicillium argentinense TaxID=1131581 RepID=A0A9W9KFX2_9EURO|nr:uncharacterized protein N7532_004717 [Penicillium argentinense]KAJ5104188.1 hypothetical protein N7532_004717 [Penicillium argentinense]
MHHLTTLLVLSASVSAAVVPSSPSTPAASTRNHLSVLDTGLPLQWRLTTRVPARLVQEEPVVHAALCDNNSYFTSLNYLKYDWNDTIVNAGELTVGQDFSNYQNGIPVPLGVGRDWTPALVRELQRPVRGMSHKAWNGAEKH